MQTKEPNSVATRREKRVPLGVEFLAGVIVLAGLAFIFAGLSFVFPEFRAADSRYPHIARVGVGAAAAAIFLGVGALHEILAVGLIRLRDAARVLSILLLGLSAAGAGLGLIATLVQFSPTALAWNIGVGVADAGAFWYLLRPQVRQVFRA